MKNMTYPDKEYRTLEDGTLLCLSRDKILKKVWRLDDEDHRWSLCVLWSGMVCTELDLFEIRFGVRPVLKGEGCECVTVPWNDKNLERYEEMTDYVAARQERLIVKMSLEIMRLNHSHVETDINRHSDRVPDEGFGFLFPDYPGDEPCIPAAVTEWMKGMPADKTVEYAVNRRKFTLNMNDMLLCKWR